MKFELFDVVITTTDLPEHGVKAGEVGTVVDVLHNPDAYYVEFASDKGETLALVPLFASQIAFPEIRKAA